MSRASALSPWRVPGSRVPADRLRRANDAPVRTAGEYVLYWMTAARRTRWNYGLQRAADWAAHLDRPLVVFEALRAGYPWASDRIHRFVLEGMADNAKRFQGTKAIYYPYVETRAGDGKGLIAALAAPAALVVTDEFPAFFLPRMIAAAAGRGPVAFEAVDSCGLVPLRAPGRAFFRAFSFRRWIQSHIAAYLGAMPDEDPLIGSSPPSGARLADAVLRRWPPAGAAVLAGERLGDLEIDHGVAPAPVHGGARAASNTALDRSPDPRKHPDADVASGLSPYPHFRHISAHQIFAALTERERWTMESLRRPASGAREGFWGMSRGAESFLDELLTWRELGYNLCAERDDYDRYESLPDWAQKTLARHAKDRRPHLYEPGELESARTHDPIWNAAQTQLVRDGTIHNYLRMLWGKKILQWSPTPRDALEVMIHLNNKYAVDGRDPNSYSGIFWVLGRYDRPWGPRRPIFGTVRTMTSESTAKKVKMRRYLERYGSD